MSETKDIKDTPENITLHNESNKNEQSQVRREESGKDEERWNTFGKLLKKSLSGDVLAMDAIKRQTGVIILVAFMIILSTSNRYSCQKSHIEESKLKKELVEAKNKAFSSFSLLTEQSRKSNILDKLKANGDSTLQASEQPPYIVNIPNEATNEQ